jgi:hypothetical protein
MLAPVRIDAGVSMQNSARNEHKFSLFNIGMDGDVIPVLACISCMVGGSLVGLEVLSEVASPMPATNLSCRSRVLPDHQGPFSD